MIPRGSYRVTLVFALILLAGSAFMALAESNNQVAEIPFSKLVVRPKVLDFSLNLDKAGAKTKHFTLINKGKLALNQVTIGAPTGAGACDFSIAGAGLTAAGGVISIPGKLKGSTANKVEIDVTFAPASSGKKLDAAVLITADASKGSTSDTVTLKGGATEKIPTPIPSATPSATPTATPSATPTATPAGCPSPGAGACPSPSTTTLLSLIPSSAIVGSTSLTVAACGCNLSNSSIIQWNGSDLPTTFVSAGQISAQIPDADIAQIGASQVTVSSGGATTPAQTFFVGNSGGDGYAMVDLGRQVNDLVNDPVNNVIYLSTPGSVIPNGNTIAVVDVASASISKAQPAGSNPDALAISDDSQYLYVAVDGAASVDRFILPALTPDISYSLGRGFLGPYYAIDLQVAPGAPHTTAMSLANAGYSPSADGGIVIFDDATPRPTIAGGFPKNDIFDSLEWGADDTTLYAANTETSGFDFYALSVNTSGVSLVADYPYSFSTYFNRIHFDRGTNLIYADNGQTLDPTTGNPAGAFTVTGLGPGALTPDSSLNRAFFVGWNSSSQSVIEAFDLSQYNLIGSITLPNAPGPAVRVIRWSANGLAFNTYDGSVYLVAGNFIH